MLAFIQDITNGSWGITLLLFLAVILVLYLARSFAHSAIKTCFETVYRGLRLFSAFILFSRKSLNQRNREVLLEQGREQIDRDLEKQFFEISKYIQRDLGGYPELQRKILEQVTKIQDDHDRSREVPLPSPDWLEAVEAVSKIDDQKKGGFGDNILKQIHKAAEIQHRESVANYRKEMAKRHKILQNIAPNWRKIAYSVDEVGNRLREVIRRSEIIDGYMERFNEVTSGSEKAVRSLKSSAITQFLISALVVAIAIGGAFFNFHLIALPMSEMVGSVERVGGVKVADLSALVIICLEISAGIFLLESLRITRLFPLIGSMDDRVRRVIMICAASVLLILACTESALAFMRDQIAADLELLRVSLSGSEPQAETPSGINEWIPLAANMTLGFILPLALTMVAIPLEYLLQTGRSVFGSLLEGVMNNIYLLLRVLANVFRQAGKLTINFYDLLIAAPLWIEAAVQKSMAKRAIIQNSQPKLQKLQDPIITETNSDDLDKQLTQGIKP